MKLSLVRLALLFNKANFFPRLTKWHNHVLNQQQWVREMENNKYWESTQRVKWDVRNTQIHSKITNQRNPHPLIKVHRFVNLQHIPCQSAKKKKWWPTPGVFSTFQGEVFGQSGEGCWRAIGRGVRGGPRGPGWGPGGWPSGKGGVGAWLVARGRARGGRWTAREPMLGTW